jgi:glucose/mannose-6-phosphate isomerase
LTICTPIFNSGYDLSIFDFYGGLMEFPISAQQIRRLDGANIFKLLISFSDQMGEAMEIMRRAQISLNGRAIHNVVVSGMGGSAIGGDLLRTYLVDLVDLPILVNRGYTLPRFVGSSTLVFVSSYSGNTEETLTACRQAVRSNSQIIAITSGGELALRSPQDIRLGQPWDIPLWPC